MVGGVFCSLASAILELSERVELAIPYPAEMLCSMLERRSSYWGLLTFGCDLSMINTVIIGSHIKVSAAAAAA